MFFLRFLYVIVVSVVYLLLSPSPSPPVRLPRRPLGFSVVSI